MKKKIKFIFIITKIPAVTRVEECTNEEIGVGADIAIGNQTPKGICDLLVINPINKITTKNILKLIRKIFLEKKIKIEQKTIINPSPNRLKKKVIRLEIDLFKFE
jgi:hypothetical protein